MNTFVFPKCFHNQLKKLGCGIWETTGEPKLQDCVSPPRTSDSKKSSLYGWGELVPLRSKFIMAADVPMLDDVIKEYLIFRGFSGTLKSFESDLKADKDKSFRVSSVRIKR